MKTFTDGELIQLLTTGEQSAFTEIYNRYWSSVFVVTYNRLKDKSDSEEIVQTIFMNLWSRRNRLKIEGSLLPYLTKAVKYEVINYYGRSRHREAYIDWMTRQRISSFSSDDELQAKMVQDIITDSIALLPERCQLVFRLRVEQGYTQKEIAQELNIAEKTVEAQLTKARKRLKIVLGSAGVIETLLLFLKM